MQKQLINVLTATFFLTGCQSFKNLTSKDYSAPSSSLLKSSENNPRFLEEISIMPGSQTSSKKYVYTSAKTKNKKPAAEDYNLKAATSLQMKYALLIDVPTRQLTNADLLQQIDDWWGTKYCRGGVNYECIDCSAFTQMIMRDVYRRRIPRTAQEQYKFSHRIQQNELTEGDLVFFQTTSRAVSHVGLYLANDKFVHASSSNGVIISDLNDDYWKSRYFSAGRVSRNDESASHTFTPNQSVQ